MNPITNTTEATNSQTLRDVLPPRTKTSASPPQTSSATLKPEIVQAIPVKSPIEQAAHAPGAVSIANPITQTAKQTDDATKDDKQLDQILKDVNQSVKKSEDTVDNRFEHLSGVKKKAAVKKAKAEEVRNSPVPIAATVVAVAVAIILTFAAYSTLGKG